MLCDKGSAASWKNGQSCNGHNDQVLQFTDSPCELGELIAPQCLQLQKSVRHCFKVKLLLVKEELL